MSNTKKTSEGKYVYEWKWDAGMSKEWLICIKALLKAVFSVQFTTHMAHARILPQFLWRFFEIASVNTANFFCNFVYTVEIADILLFIIILSFQY